MGKAVRLDKLLADAGAGTRSQVKQLIKKGMVQVNGAGAKSPEQKVIPGEDEILLSGERVELAEEFVYFLLNKPSGCVTATEDNRDKTVMDYIHSQRKGLFPVGRLDKDTEGLLLITDDGQLAHQLLSPKKHVEKTYFARVKGIVTDEDVQAMAEGLDIGEPKPALPAKLSILAADREKDVSEIHLTICEGKFHQVKRMVKAVGKEVIYLKRISMGKLTLPNDLKPGEYRKIEREEII